MKNLFLRRTIFAAAIVVFAGICEKLNAQSLEEAIKLTKSERYEDAENEFKAVIAKTPNNSDAYFYYGVNVLLSNIADPYSSTIAEVTTQASDLFRKGLQVDSMNALNNIGLGMATLYLKNDTLTANTYFKKAEVQFPKKKKKYTNKEVTYLIQLAEAQLFSKKPNYQRAIAYLTVAQEVAPTNAAPFLSMGKVYDHSMDASAAIANYKKANYLDPKNVIALVKIGNIYMRSRNRNEAKNYFEQAIEIDSTYAPVYKYLGEMYGQLRVYNYSKDNYKKYLELSGNNIPAKVSYVGSLFQAADYAEAYANIQEILSVDKSRNNLNRLAAYSAYEKKPADYPAALNYIETFFKNTTPEKIITRDYTYYGRILLKLRKDSAMIDKGFEKFKIAYSMDTTDKMLLSEIAFNAYNLKRYDIATEMYTKKIEAGSTDENDYINLGKSYYSTNQLGKADTVFTKLTVIEPQNIQGYRWIASTYSKMDPDSKQGLAKPKYEILLEKAQADTVKNSAVIAEACSYLGAYYMFNVKPKPDYDKSAMYFTRLITLDPKNTSNVVKGYQSVAIIEYSQKNYAKARAAYSKILAIDPRNEAAKQGLEALKKIKQ